VLLSDEGTETRCACLHNPDGVVPLKLLLFVRGRYVSFLLDFLFALGFALPLHPQEAIRCIDFQLNPSSWTSTSLVPTMRPHSPVVFPTRAMVCKRLCLNSYPRASVVPVRRAIPPADCVIHPEEKASGQPRAADCQQMLHWECYGCKARGVWVSAPRSEFPVVLRRSFVRRVPTQSS